MEKTVCVCVFFFLGGGGKLPLGLLPMLSNKTTKI